MFRKCDICEFEAKSPKSLSQHIRNNHSIYTVQSYYDKFLKSDGEGICKRTGCNNPTTFQSIAKGYCQYCCVKCGSLDTREHMKQTCIDKYGYANAFNSEGARKKALETRRSNRRLLLEKESKKLIESIDKDNKCQCQICGKTFLSPKSCSRHISRKHYLSVVEYYNTFFKQDDMEGTCPISGKPTTFIGLERGFRKLNYEAAGYAGVPRMREFRRKEVLKRIREKEVEKNIHIVNIQDLSTEKGESFVTFPLNILCMGCGLVYQSSWMNVRGGEKNGRCPVCHPKITSQSQEERELLGYIKTIYNGPITESAKIIKDPLTGKRLEVDIYFPKLNIGIEYNGLYWHSEAIKTNPDVHIKKTKLCQQKGIKLIHVFEDEWLHKTEIVKGRLTQILGVNHRTIHARKCQIKEIEPKLKNEFLNENHIQGNDQSTIKIGAFYNDVLVAVMTFTHGNVTRNGDPSKKTIWELNRFCTKINEHIPGIASKLLKYFQSNYTWSEIYSYADRRWSTGNIYTVLGFELKTESAPQYWYVDLNLIKRLHRSNLRKRPDEPKDVPEWQLRLDEGYYRIWDCGVIKFSMINI